MVANLLSSARRLLQSQSPGRVRGLLSASMGGQLSHCPCHLLGRSRTLSHNLNNSERRNPGLTRGGFTLTEVMIALSITLLILLAMMQAFTIASKDIGQGRNRLLLAERMQTATDLIRSDLEQLSLNVEPLVSSTEDLGYFECVDGPFRDMTFSQVPNNSTLGDFDDVLAFTIRSDDKPFRGRFGVLVDPDGTANSGDEYLASTVIESMEAEVIYFTRRTDPTLSAAERRRDGTPLAGNGEVDYGDPIRLYRRVLLVRPDLYNSAQLAFVVNDSVNRYDSYVSGLATSGAITPSTEDRLLNRSNYAKFLQFNDVSLRWDPTLTPASFQPNSLGTLSHPKNRTAHDMFSFPHPMLVNDPRDIDDSTPLPAVGARTYLSDLISLGILAGNDVVLENVAAFDVKLFDPKCDVYEYAGLPVTPDDPGWATARASYISGGGTTPDRGCYVDLGSMEYRVITGPVTTVPPPYSPGVPGQTAAAVPAESYWFAYWDNERDLTSEPAANYYTNLFSSYIAASGGPVYTTWPDSFESDGLDNDGDGLVDEGSDGIPVGVAVPDLFNDADSAPPYAFPVSSIKVTLRTASYDADRQQTSASDQIVQNQIVVSTTNQ